MSDRSSDPFVRVPSERSPEIAEPSVPALTYKGEGLSAGLVLRLFRMGKRQSQRRYAWVSETRSFRRCEEESLVQLASSWVRANPEAARWVRDIRPERTSLEQDLIAKVGAVEPEYVVEKLGFRDTDEDYAEHCRAWMEEWRLQSVPIQAMFGKAIEDGSFGWSVLPDFLDREGLPTFFETLDERAWAALGTDEKRGYREDDDEPGRKRYVKLNVDGKKKVRREYGTKDDKASREAHKEAISRYLLRHRPVAVRLFPALDCAPILTRGVGKDHWVCAALITRELFEPNELIHAGYGWPGMGDRLLVPQATNADGSSVDIAADEWGKDGQVYLYTARLVCRDDEGHERPLVLWTVGGTATSYALEGQGTEPEDHDAGDVGMFDIYQALKYTDPETGRTCGPEGALWGYHGGRHTEDDNPDYYWAPAIHHVIPLIRQIEGNTTQANAHISVSGTPGYVQKIDPALAASEVGADAILDQHGDLLRFKIPRSGEVSPSTGDVEPFAPAALSRDMWLKRQADELALQAATVGFKMPEGASGASGIAQVTEMATGQMAQRQVRDGVKAATIAMGEAARRILVAYCHRFDIGWPLQTTQERSIGGDVRSARGLAEFDFRWIGQGNYAIDAEYPEEENLARVDMEMTLDQAGIGNPERVWKALGERDFKNEYKKVVKWQLLRSPEYQMKLRMKYAQQTGDKELIQALKALQARQEITPGGLPGARNGLPTQALPNRAQPAPSAQSVGTGSDQRGGVQGAEMANDQRVADMQSALTRTNGAA